MQRLWIIHALKKAGSDVSVILRGAAVNYAVDGQDPSGLSLGGISIDHAPVLDQDLRKMISAGISVQVIREDVQERGIPLDTWSRISS